MTNEMNFMMKSEWRESAARDIAVEMNKYLAESPTLTDGDLFAIGCTFTSDSEIIDNAMTIVRRGEEALRAENDGSSENSPNGNC